MTVGINEFYSAFKTGIAAEARISFETRQLLHLANA
jgi:hypothetical protein